MNQLVRVSCVDAALLIFARHINRPPENMAFNKLDKCLKVYVVLACDMIC
jgi:hypothetical protein